MDRKFCAAALLTAFFGLFPGHASAQNTYDVYVDSNGANNGCTITLPGGTFNGADARLRVTATSGAAPQVTGVSYAPCAGGTFGATVPVSGAYPVGLNNGIGGSDVIELGASVQAVFQGSTSARFGFAAQNATGSDVLFTVNGGQGGPIGLGVAYSIPLFGLGGLLLLAALLLVAAKRARRHRLTLRLLAIGLLLTSGIALAANFIVDGQVGDWAGVPAAANDPLGDATNGSSNIDLRAAFLAIEGGTVFFRIDVADLQNQAPVATPQAVTTNEDTAVTITLASTDLENDPRTYAIVTQPVNGTLGAVTQVPPASATVVYTPNADFNGSDTFTFRATDAQGAASAPATVTITINAVNDRPTFTATNPPAVNEDAAAQTIANWATFSAGPANESGQAVLAYTVSNVSNAALFSAAPAVATNGTLTYTPAANANGTSTFDVVVQDNGGTANGGIDTSAVQTFTITVNAANDPPVLTAGAVTAYTENGAPIAIDGTVTVADPDNANLASATVQVTTGFQAGADVLACPAACGGLTASFAGSTLTLTGSATLATYQAALRSITFANTSENPTAGARTITWIGNDGTVASAPVTSTVNVAAVNDPPVNTVPGPQQVAAGATLTFAGTISVADPDAGASFLANVSVPPGQGTLAPGAGSGATITGSGTNILQINGTLAQVNAALNGLTYTAPATSVATALTLLSSDGSLTDTDSVPISVDAAPTVTTTTPANGATGVGTNTTLTVNFSENVDVTAGGITLTCGGPNLVTTGLPVANTNTVTVNTAGIPAGTLCTGTVLAANVTDSDAIDPPNNLAANFTWTFTSDAAPTVTTTTPANGATNVATNTSLVVNFSENVNVAAGGVTLTCGAGNLVTTGLPAANTNTVTVNTAGIPAGATCTGTVLAASVADADAGDPPDNLAANFTWSFTTDAAPSVTTVTPANGATNVATNTSLTVNFSEAVNVAAGGITLTCGAGNLVSGGLPVTNSSAVTVTTAGVPAGTLCTATVVAANVADFDSNDPPDAMAANFTWQFTTDVAPSVTAVTPPNATTALVGTNITVTFSEPVTVSGTWFTLACGTSGTRDTSNSVVSGGPTTYTVNPNVDFTPGESCNNTIVAAQVADVDAGDPPDNMAANFTWSFATDAAPAVQAVTPPNLSIGQAGDTNVTITFTEPVNATGTWFQIACPTSGTRTPANSVVTGGPAAFTINPNIDFAPGESCTATVFAASVTDVDAADPPDNMVADFVWQFAIDQAPSVTTTTPSNGATNLATNQAITINFSEPVDLSGTAVTIGCPGAVAFTGLPATNVSSVVLTPSAALPTGATCTVTVVAAQVADADANDPPNNMAANFVFSFTTDAAPAVTTVTPTNASTQVATNTNLVVNFSEPVDITAGGITLDCGGPIAVAGLPATNATSVTITPTVAVAENTLCNATVLAASVSDTDANDPPNNLAANFAWSFTTDAAPTVTSTIPVNGATGVAPNATVTVNFSEPVNATVASFAIECPTGNVRTFSLSASPASSFVLTPTTNLPAGTVCSVAVLAGGISDVDAGDPPNNLPSSVFFSFTVPSVANDDGFYIGTPNLTLAIPAAAAPNNLNVFANDQLGGGDVVTGYGPNAGSCNTAPGNSAATAGGGNVTMLPNGNFTFNGAPGARTNDSFCYTISGGDTAIVTVTFQGTQAVWFVDPTAAAGGNGTQAAPFQNIGAGAGTFATAAGDIAGDTIFVADGASTCGVTLLNNQKIVGDGSSGTLGALATGVTVVSGSSLPAFSGTDPVLTAGAGSCVTLAQGNLVRGLTIANSAVNDILGSNYGTFTITEATLNGTGTALNLTNGTLAATMDDLDVTSSAGAGILLSQTAGSYATAGALTTIAGTATQGILVTQSTGSFAFGNVSTTGGTDAISLQNNSAGTRTFGNVTIATPSANGFLHAVGGGITTITGTTTITNPGANGIDIDANTTAVSFQGTTTVGKNSGGTAVDVTNSTGALTFAQLDITTTGATGLNVTSSLFRATSGTISATNRPAIVSSAANWGTSPNNTVFTSVSSTSSNGEGIFLTNSLGALTMNGGAIATNQNNQPAFRNAGSAGAGITYAGTITKTNAGNLVQVETAGGGSITLSGNLSCTTNCEGIDVDSHNGGTVTFSGATKTLNTVANVAVNLTNNTGATISFTNGGLDVDTTSATGFNATGGGTVTVSAGGNANTIDSTTGTALNVQNTTIGAGGLNFRNISSVGGSNSGIVLNNTGSANGLTVSGNGGTCSSAAGSCTGGTIATKTGADASATQGSGIWLSSTGPVSIDRMQLNDHQNYAIRGQSVAGFTLTNSRVTGANGNNAAIDEGSIIFDGLTGTSTFTNDVIQGGIEDNMRVRNSSGTANDIVVSGSSFTNAPNDNLIIEPSGTATVTTHVTGNTFTGAGGDHFQTATSNSATLNVIFTGNFYSNGFAGSLLGGITISGGNAGSTERVNFDVSNNGTAANPLVGSVQGGAININQGNGGGTWQGQVNNNVIGNTAVANSGAAQSSGIRVENHSPTGTLTALITNNLVRQWNNGPAINTQAGDAGNASNSGAVNFTVTGNSSTNPGPLSQHGFVGNIGAGFNAAPFATNVACVDVRTNTMDGNAANGGVGVRLRQREQSTIRVRNYTGAIYDIAAVAAFESTANPGSTANAATSSAGPGYLNTSPAGAQCAQPTVPN